MKNNELPTIQLDDLEPQKMSKEDKEEFAVYGILVFFVAIPVIIYWAKMAMFYMNNS